jgi:voltage-gated potassium channel Kch
MARLLSIASVPRRLRWWHFALPAVGTLMLGYLGFRACVGPPADLRDVLDLIYKSFQLFVFESGMDCGPRAPWTLQAARFMAPVVPVTAVVYALLLALRDQIRLGRLLTIRNHAVVLGLGRKGSQLVRDFRKSGIPVVAIELDENNDYVPYCLNLGALVLIGSAGDTAMLRRAAVHRARTIVAISGNDGVNVDSMLKIHGLIQKSSNRRLRKVSGYVQVVDFNLCALFKSHEVFADCSDRFAVRVFNVHEATVRRLFDEHPLDRRSIGADNRQVPHLICIGMGTTGEATVVQAARIGHFANGRKLRVTIVDLQAGKRSIVFYGRHGWVREVCELEFIEGDVADENVLLELRRRIEDSDALCSFVICMNDDSLNLKTALHLHAFLNRPDLPFCVRMMEVDGLTVLLEKKDKVTDLPIHPFGMGSLVCTRQMLDGPDQMRRARTLHDAARDGLTTLREPGDENLWERLAELRREAFCVQADHLPVMLRGVGFELVPTGATATPDTLFSEEEIETLARMEFHRRQTDRLLAAHNCIMTTTAPDPGLQGRTWRRLDSQEQQRYRDHVAALPGILARAALGIRRAGHPAANAPPA